MENKNSQNNLDDAIRAMQQTEPTAEQAKLSASRVLAKLSQEQPVGVPERFQTDADFQAALKPYLRNELSEAQRMLVDDRLGSSPVYRRQLNELRGNVREFVAPQSKGSARRSFAPWAIAAGVLMTVGYFSTDSMDRLMAPAGARAEIASVSGEIYTVSAAGLQPVKAGSPLAENQAVRTAKGSSAVVRLPDGSLIEMNERAELSISAAYSGSTVRLDRGNIVIQAAKQKRGALKVSTRDSTVSVKGTIFSVAAGLRGTQVAVVEGHVVVDQGGKQEDLLPGEVTASNATLKRTNVTEQVAWSKDSGRYVAMLGELTAIRKQIELLPTPELRMNSKLLKYLPADTAVYVAIPNISGTVADATRIFEDRLKQSPALQQWWDTKQVADLRTIAEKLRSAGSQVGDEIVFGASVNGLKGLGEPFLLAEVKGAAAKSSLEAQMKEFTGGTASIENVSLSDRFLVVSPNQASVARIQGALATEGGFESTALAATVKQSYAKGAGWILAVDMEQILSQSVGRMQNDAMSLTGINKMRHLMVEKRDSSGNSDTRASLSFSGPRTGIASWLAAPAPMPSLDYVSPDATFAMSAVTKDAKEMAAEFFNVLGTASTGQNRTETELGISIVGDLAEPLGGEVTFAIDGPLVPVPTWLMAVEVYDAGRLGAALRRSVDTLKAKGGPQAASLNLSEEMVQGRTWYKIKSANLPVEMNFTYASGYMVAGISRDSVAKALGNRDSLMSLPRSQRFRDLLPRDAQVNASGIVYFHMGSGLKGLADQVRNGLDLTEEQKKAIDQLTANSAPVLICAYAGPDSITVASTSGFFGFGLDTLLQAGRGGPILPEIIGSAMGRSKPLAQ